MDDLGKVCANKKCRKRIPVLESMCPLCRKVDYCNNTCLRQDRRRHRGECGFIRRVFKRKIDALDADPPALILEEIASNPVLREELASLYFLSLRRECDYGCMMMWITEMNELAVAYSSGSKVKSTWFTFVPSRNLEDDVRMFGLVEMAKMSIPINQMISVAVVIEDANTNIRGVYARMFEVSLTKEKK